MNGRDDLPRTDEAPPRSEVARRDRLIAVSGQADIDSFGQVSHPGDPRAQVVAVVGRIRERLERVGAELSDLTRLVVFHVPEPGCGEREMRDLLARALGPDVVTTLTMVPLPRLVAPGLLLAVDAYAMRGAAGRRIERVPLDVPELASMPAPFCPRPIGDRHDCGRGKNSRLDYRRVSDGNSTRAGSRGESVTAATCSQGISTSPGRRGRCAPLTARPDLAWLRASNDMVHRCLPNLVSRLSSPTRTTPPGRRAPG